MMTKKRNGSLSRTSIPLYARHYIRRLDAYRETQEAHRCWRRVFNRFSSDDYVSLKVHTQALLLAWLTKSSHWFVDFCDAEKVPNAKSLHGAEGPLLRQIAVLYQLLDEVQRGRVSVKDAVLDDTDGLAAVR